MPRINAAAVRCFREARLLTITELARRSGIPRTAINAYERGNRTPTSATLARLAEACRHTLDASPRPTIDESVNARALERVLPGHCS